MKIVTMTITTTMETESVPIKGTDQFVFVYSRLPDMPDTIYHHVMEAKKYAKAKKPTDIKAYQFVMPHLKKDRYKAMYGIFSKAQYEAIKDGFHDWYDEKKYAPVKLEFGQEFPDDCIVLGYCSADNSFCYLDGKYVNRVVRDSYLHSSYDIRAIVKNERDNPDVIIMQERDWHGTDRDPIYYVRGNGDTLNIGLRLTDEQNEAYRLLDWYERSLFLAEHTILGKYKRPERLSYSSDYDDD